MIRVARRIEDLADPRWARLVKGQRLPLVHHGGVYVFVTPGDHKKDVTREFRGLTTAMALYLYAYLDTDERRALRAAAGPKAKKHTRKKSSGTLHARTKNAKTTAAKRAREVAARARMSVARRAMMALRGRVRGTLIHEQIEQQAQFDKQTRRSMDRDAIHPWVDLYLDDIEDRDWLYVCPEFKTVDERVGLAFRIDDVLADPSGRILFVERKTGYDSDRAWNLVDARWTFPWPTTQEQQLRGIKHPIDQASFPCTARNRAVMEVALGVMMAVRNIPLADAHYAAFISRLNDAGPQWQEVKLSFIRWAAIFVYPYLGACVAEDRLQKKTKKVGSN